MSSETELIDRIKSGECAIKSIGSEGKIVGFVFEHPGRLSTDARINIRAELEAFTAKMGLVVPSLVMMEGSVLRAVVEVEKAP